MGNTAEQSACIKSIMGPVDVSAGAGSGKTYTLTQRIAYALETPGTGVDSIEQVCAITFTKKAAAELKGRIRTTLRAKGMFEQAKLVDGAWISTIHGMCARILRTSALELGIDPAFVVLEDEVADLMSAAINAELEQAQENGLSQSPYAELFAAYSLFPAGDFSPSVSGMLTSILNAAKALPHGFDDLQLLMAHEDQGKLARQLLENYQNSLALLQTIKSGKTVDSNIAKAQQACEALENYLIDTAAQAQETVSGEGAAAAAQLRLLDVLQSCPKLSLCGSAEQRESMGDYARHHSELVYRVAISESDVLFSQLVDLAKRAEERFAAIKKELGGLDNNDLIRLTLKSLEQPHIRQLYADKFRLVMVDEFQDTDALQLAIIGYLAGPGKRYLCTVGDAQQSIYAFRGADVEVYRAYQQQLFDQEILANGGRPQALKLTANFRSHQDILAFVKAVCSQRTVFGRDFLDLSAQYDGEGYKAHLPRVRVEVTAVPPKVKIEHALPAQTQKIVQYFTEMKQAGHKLSDMVLLLGAMKNAQTYAEAIRAAGFECVITGGSLFAKSLEARAVAQLALVVVNPRETQMLFNTLTGPFFELPADHIVQLSTGLVDGKPSVPYKRVLDEGYRAMRQMLFGNQGAQLEQKIPALAHAARVLDAASRSLKWQSLSDALLVAIRESGYFARMETQGAQGTAQAANVMKALRMIASLEEKGGVGASAVAESFAAQIDAGMKEAPGSLNVAGQEAISIMTIHASKGLQFPIVALADFAKNHRPSGLLVQRVQGKTYAALMPKGDDIANVKCGSTYVFSVASDDLELTEAGIRSANPLNQRAILASASTQAALAEEQRLFYVGATRAKESMALFISIKEKEKDPEQAYTGVYKQIVTALFPEGVVPEGESSVDYGGTETVPVRKSTVREEDSAAGECPADSADECPADECPADSAEAGECRTIEIYEQQPHLPLPAKPLMNTITGLMSYSLLSAAHSTGAAAEPANDQADLNQKPQSTAIPLGFAEADQDDMSEDNVQLFTQRTYDEDKATDFGSAFHRAAQISMLESFDVAQARIPALAQTYGVQNVQRMEEAFGRWAKSIAATRALHALARRPELPFSQAFEGTGLTLEGAMDLVCQESDGRVFVVDYKTGGRASETPDQLYEKHHLQAVCYAYVLLKNGYQQADFSFVRVDREDPMGQDSLQSVCYTFVQDDLPAITELIASYVQHL